MRYMYLIFITVLAACGSGESGSGGGGDAVTIVDQTKQTLSISAMESRPDCTEANVNQLVYIEEEGFFWKCTNQLIWKNIEPKSARSQLLSVVETYESPCESGGYKINIGFDTNIDGVLDENEVQQTEKVCHGDKPQESSSIDIQDVAKGTRECGANGGIRVTVGLDQEDGSNLSLLENKTSKIVCNGSKGESSIAINSLISMSDTKFSSCSQGGKVIRTGLDNNSDNTLDSSEVTKTETICNGEPGSPGADGSNDVRKAFDLYEKYRASVFRLIITIGSAQYQATGFRCDGNYICTARHAVNIGTVNAVQIKDVWSFKDTVHSTPLATLINPTIIKHSTRDVAKIWASSLTWVGDSLPIDFVGSRPETLTPTLVMSFPKTLEDMFSDFAYVINDEIGHCDSVFWGCVEDFYDFTTSNDTDPGSSGAPIFNVSTGNVIGIVNAGPTPTDASGNWTWAVKAKYFDDL